MFMFNLPHLNSSVLKERRRELRKNSTEAEDTLWQYLKNNRLGFRFNRQFGIENFIVDFCCRGLRLIIEVDGPIHEKEDIAEHDQIRSDILEGFGYKILRFANDEVLNNISLVLERIKVEIYSPPSLGGGEGPRLPSVTLDGGEKGWGI